MTESLLSLDEQRAYYDGRWGDLCHDFSVVEAARLTWICGILGEARLRLGRPLKILDYGCGQGRYAALACQFGTVDAVDLSESGIAVARECFPGPSYHCADVYEYQPSATYDAILSIEVLEHVPDQRLYCRRMRQMISPAGTLLLTMPNKLAAARYWKPAERQVSRQPLENWLLSNELRSLLRTSGFKVRRVTTKYVAYDRQGMRRIANSVKLNRLTGGGVRRIWEMLGKGLFLFAVAQAAKPSADTRDAGSKN
jgi:2-polyprenyl-3-methyl-5-hydroxy-6-metoxy-1,4-benzoquinol methylase